MRALLAVGILLLAGCTSTDADPGAAEPGSPAGSSDVVRSASTFAPPAGVTVTDVPDRPVGVAGRAARLRQRPGRVRRGAQVGPTVRRIDTATRAIGDPLVLDEAGPTTENVAAAIVGDTLVVSHPEVRRLHSVPLGLLHR